jgi:hypothetical protein
MSRRQLLDALKNAGWATVSSLGTNVEGASRELTVLAQSLGEIAPGRGRQAVEIVVPERTESARPGSLSSKYGLGPLPLHNDTAHWIVPCHYLLLACVNPGPTPTPTVVLDSTTADLSDAEMNACRSAVHTIRNGRSSFYGSIWEQGRPFIRLDPGCMTPLSPEGVIALEAFDIERQEKRLAQHDWKVGDILVLDNWRCLHARGFRTLTDRGRVLLRAMVR